LFFCFFSIFFIFDDISQYTKQKTIKTTNNFLL
jgi:hypothetical protein